jgi:transposase
MWLLLHEPEDLKETDAASRHALFRLSPPLAGLSALAQELVHLIRDRTSEALLPWLERAKECSYEELQRFAQSLEKEALAAQAALTQPWSNAQVEGHITRREACSNATCMISLANWR